MTAERLKTLARDCGFDLAGVAAAAPALDAPRYHAWTAAGHAAEMHYLTDHRAALRDDPRTLLPTAHSILCCAKLYNGPQPYSTTLDDYTLGWISRYAWGEDYHHVLRRQFESLVSRLQSEFPAPFDYRICVDTAPLLERSYARLAGLGWIGKNTCLINQRSGSWFFLGELLLSVPLTPDAPPPDRCGSCTRCIDACPTQALTPYQLDSRLCVSYFTIEHRGAIPLALRSGLTHHIFGCDICQDVCPWNRHAPVTTSFQPRAFAPPLLAMAELSETEFRALFRATPVSRARYSGFLRNVAVAMGNAPAPNFREPLRRLAASPDTLVSEHARWALAKLGDAA